MLGIQRRLGQAVNVFKNRINSSSKLKLNDETFIIPHKEKFHHEHLISYEDYFEYFIRVSLGMKSGAFVDIGANVGQMLLKLRSIDQKRKYIGFEISVSCCEYVNKIIEINSLNNCTLVPIGLSDSSRMVSMYFSNSSDPQATVVGDFWTTANKRKYKRRVYVETGDTVLSADKETPIGIIKIDVEGGELEVLRGLNKTISLHRPIILSEILPYIMLDNNLEEDTMRRRAERCFQLMAFINENQYICFRALPEAKIEIPENFGAEVFDATKTNYVMIPREIESSFRKHFAS